MCEGPYLCRLLTRISHHILSELIIVHERTIQISQHNVSEQIVVQAMDYTNKPIYLVGTGHGTCDGLYR